jgi:SOS-response transcriptional repressor LexA/DNA-binding transcriptional regulator YiaG
LDKVQISSANLYAIGMMGATFSFRRIKNFIDTAWRWSYLGTDNGTKSLLVGAMRRLKSKSNTAPKPEWATSVSDLRHHLNLSQTIFGQRLHSSAMGVSRWERGAQEPPSHSYIELGNLAGDPLCWYFWGRAGLRAEDLTRVIPKLRNRISQRHAIDFQTVRAGSTGKKLNTPHLVALPLLKVAVASHGGKGYASTLLQDAPVETMIAAPKDWCPNPASTFCLRVTGDSMRPLICYILAVDSRQTGLSELNDKVVIAWNKEMGLMVSRLQHYDHTEVLQPENKEYESIVLNNRNKWKILAKVLWWVGNAS